MLQFLGGMLLLLPICAAADTALSEDGRRKVAEFARRTASSFEVGGAGIGRQFDAIFGDKLFSLRGVVRYFFFAVFVSVASFLIVGSINASTLSSNIETMIEVATSEAALLLLASLIFLWIFDVFSFVQTRLFMRAAIEGKKVSVHIIFLVVDFFVSIIVFMCGFAFVRMLVWLIVFNNMSEPISIGTDRVNTGLLILYVNQLEDVTDTSYDELANSSVAAAVAKSVIAREDFDIVKSELLKYTASRYIEQGVRNSPSSDIVIIESWNACVDDDSITTREMERFTALVATRMLFVTSLDMNASWPVEEREAIKIIEESVEASFRGNLVFGEGCQYPTTYLNLALSPDRLLKEIRLSDILASSFSLSIEGLASAVRSKFGLYEMYYSSEDVVPLLNSSLTSSSFDLGRVRNGAAEKEAVRTLVERNSRGIARSVAERDIGLVLPFSTLALSSLGASMLFWIFYIVTTLGFMSVLIARFVSGAFPLFSMNKYPVTAIFLALATLAGVVSLGGTLASMVFGIVL